MSRSCARTSARIFRRSFGTSTPPSGLSGVIRRAAFSFSENSYDHWVPLILADRINMFEGVAEDIARCHIPNVFGEMALKAEWEHNRKNLVSRIAVGAAIAATLFLLLRGNREEENREYEE